MAELACAYAVQALPPSEVAATEAHIASCPDCRRELESLCLVVDRFLSWPTDVLRPRTSLQTRLAHRIAEETGIRRRRGGGPSRIGSRWHSGLLATDTKRDRVRGGARSAA